MRTNCDQHTRTTTRTPPTHLHSHAQHTPAGLHDKIELKAGEALFLPKEVWHRSFSISSHLTLYQVSFELARPCFFPRRSGTGLLDLVQCQKRPNTPSRVPPSALPNLSMRASACALLPPMGPKNPGGVRAAWQLRLVHSKALASLVYVMLCAQGWNRRATQEVV